MQLVDQLAKGDPDGWNTAFRCLYPVAFEAARSKLTEPFQSECEDVAMETLSDILDAGGNLASDDELKPLTAAIARNKASDRLRRQFAGKRGGSKVQSIETADESSATDAIFCPQSDFLEQLSVQEVHELLIALTSDVKKEYRVVLRDHFFDHLTHKEIAKKREISVGSVGVYVQRGIASLRSAIARKPRLQQEFLAMLSDSNLVGVLLPMIAAIQLGGRFVLQGGVQYSQPGRRQVASMGPDGKWKVITEAPSDEELLRMASEELVTVPTLRIDQLHSLNEKFQAKYRPVF
jgi:RNA polymerase sigma factor (sigma-70 family)